MLPTQTALAFNVGDPTTIRAYFEKIRDLVKAGEAFPVKFDEVWPLAYDRKDAAVRYLKSDFSQDYDYQAVHKNVDLKKGSSRQLVYSLSVSCMEWFIARKIRPVFEVYRKVFHQALNMVLHVPQIALQERLDKIEKALSLMKRESARQFKVRKAQFWYNARIRQEQRTKTKEERERQELFDLFNRYIKVQHYEHPLFTLNRVMELVNTHFNCDLTKGQKTGEHLFETAIRYNMGYAVREVIKSHMINSDKL